MTPPGSPPPGSPPPNSPPPAAPALVTVDVWSVSARRVPQAFGRMAVDRGRLRRLPGLRFAKLLGTGSGRTFSPRDADLGHWALLAAWDDDHGPGTLDRSASARAWGRLADEHARFLLRPLSSRGSWSGRAPFGSPVPPRWDGPVAVVTRARIRPRYWRRFWSAVPPVSADLQATPGLELALGIGEAPIGLQGTFSVWRTNRDVTEFAHRRAAHADVVARTHRTGWYAEELFARFALLGASGTVMGRRAEDLAAGP